MAENNSKKAVALDDLKVVTEDIYTKIDNLAPKDVVREAVKNIADCKNVVDNVRFSSSSDAEDIIPKDDNILVVNPQIAERQYPYLGDYYEEDIYNYVKQNKRLPWDVIDMTYITRADYFLNSSIYGELTIVPKLINTDILQSCEHLYYNNRNLIKVQSFDNLSDCVNMTRMFDSCSSIKDIPDFPKIGYKANCKWMFAYCENLEKAPAISGYIGNAGDMFYYCKNLTTVPEYDLSECDDFDMMFYGCESLPEEFPWEIDCRNITETRGFSLMFSSSSVKKVTLKNVRKIFNPDNPDNVLRDSTLSIHLGKSDLEVVVKNYLTY